MFDRGLLRLFAALAALGLVTGCGAEGAPAPTANPSTTTTASVATPGVSSPPATPTIVTAVASPNGLAGEADIADNFDPATGVVPTFYGAAPYFRGGLPQANETGEGDFRFTCLAGQLSKDDPIVYPGQPGAAHLHQFYGNTGANANSTYQSLRTTGQSTCSDPQFGPVNRTAYWMPAMLDGAGNAVKPDYIMTYYKSPPTNSATCMVYAPSGGNCVPLPNGIRYIFGYDMKTGLGGPDDTNTIGAMMNHYACWGENGTTEPLLGGQYFKTIDDIVAAGCPAGAHLGIHFVAPACWDGKNLDTPDHRSHVVYSTRLLTTIQGRGCPADHPYLLPNYSGFVMYTTDANFAAGKWRLSSDDMASAMTGRRVAAGSTLHFDYFEAWSPVVKATWNKFCIQASMNCSGNDLGNGTVINPGDTGSKEGMASHIHNLVPVSSIL